MAARTLTGTPEQWQRVADRVYSRRMELGYTAEQLVERAGAGLSLTVLSLVENSKQTSYSVRAMAALCRGLGWRGDSIEGILTGEEPTELRPELTPSTTDERLDRIESHIAELRELVKALADQRKSDKSSTRS